MSLPSTCGLMCHRTLMKVEAAAAPPPSDKQNKTKKRDCREVGSKPKPDEVYRVPQTETPPPVSFCHSIDAC